MHYRYSAGFALATATCVAMAQGPDLSFSTYAISGGGYEYDAVQQQNGSYKWQLAYEEPEEDDNLGLNFSDTFTLTGGVGAATVIIPISITASGSGAGSWDASGTLFTDFAALAGYDISDSSFQGGTYQNGVFYMNVSFTYGQSLYLTMGNNIFANSPQAADSGCGTPGPQNMICLGSNQEYTTLSNSIPYFVLPEGATLTAASGLIYPVVSVPEPTAYALMLGGLSALGLLAGRKRRVRQ